MTTHNRRDFLKLAFGAVAIAATPIALSEALTESLPLIYGDGIWDDWAGLQAALDGKPVAIRTERVRLYSNRVCLGGGTYRITQGLRFRANSPVVFDGESCTIQTDFPPDYRGAIFNLESASEVNLNNCHLIDERVVADPRTIWVAG